MNNLEKYIYFTSQSVQSICNSLFNRLGINGFSYSRVFNDGSRSELWSNAQALVHTFLNKKYIASSYTPSNFSSNERYVFLLNKIESCSKNMAENYTNQLEDQKKLFNQDNCFMIVNKEEEYSEYFIFYTPQNFKSAINFYLNEVVELENFSNYFKERASNLLQIADQNKIIKPWRNANDLKSNKQNKKISKLFKSLLSIRESEVAQYILDGMTAKEIALKMNLSFRTVESYSDNIKNKLGCNTKTHLIIKLYRLKGCQNNV